MVPTHAAELHEVAVVVQLIEPLHAVPGRQAPHAAGASPHEAAVDEALAGLRPVELAHHRQRRVDGLDVVEPHWFAKRVGVWCRLCISSSVFDSSM